MWRPPYPPYRTHPSWDILKPLLRSHIQRMRDTGRPRAHGTHSSAFFYCKRLGAVSATSVQQSLSHIFDRIERGVMEPGAMCGTLAAQSIGGRDADDVEHVPFSGLGMPNGVWRPRFKELIDCSKIATPSMRLYLRSNLSSNEDVVRLMASNLPTRALRPHVTSWSVVPSTQ